ncbi:MAG: VacJ family lipoprotein [Cocleimonas sp.]
MLSSKKYLFKFCTCVSLLLLLTACSNTNTNVSGSSQNNAQTIDRYENINRKIFSFNRGVDSLLLKPAAKVYKKVTPKFVDKSIGNFFSNLGDVGNIINNTLQGKFADAASDTERVVFNSTLGFAGFVDIASAVGIQKHNEDFGQTLAKWGVKSGPYVMLPFLGPSTVRDAVARVSVDRFTDPASYSDESAALFVTKTVKRRSDFFAEEEVINGLSDDTYSALRDVWLDNRKFLIRDGVADETTDSDLIDELEDLDSQ